MTATVFTEEGREEKQILPETDRHYIRANGVCSVFSLGAYQNIRELLVKSPVPVNIYLHARNQFYSRELRTFLGFEGKQSYVVTVKRIKNLQLPEASCFTGWCQLNIKEWIKYHV